MALDKVSTSAIYVSPSVKQRYIHAHLAEELEEPKHDISCSYYSFLSTAQSFSSHVQMWELEHKEGWALKNWLFWTVVLEKTLESPLDSKEIKPVNLKGDQSWIFTGRTVAKAEAPILWQPDAKSQLIRKDPDAGKDWRQKEKEAAEDGMVR